MHKRLFLCKGLAFAKSSERNFEGAPFYGEVVEGSVFFAYMQILRGLFLSNKKSDASRHRFCICIFGVVLLYVQNEAN